jgi:hypothetical protein
LVFTDDRQSVWGIERNCRQSTQKRWVSIEITGWKFWEEFKKVNHEDLKDDFGIAQHEPGAKMIPVN